MVEEPNKEGHDETIGVDKSFDEAVEVMALRKDKNRSGLGRVTSSGDVVRTGPEEEWFAIQEGFPTTWRVSRRHWDTLFPIGKEQIDWMHRVGIQIGVQTEEEKEQAVRLLWIWRDIFVEQLCDLPMTDLVTHAIPTYPGIRAHRARDPIYAMDEIRWQKQILPEMIGKIVERGTSPWVAKTTWVSKKETIVDENGRWPLRMVHTYCQLNDATIKTNYPMKRMEPILDELANPQYRYFFSADAAYGFYAVPIYPPHAYKTAFNTILGQFYYLRMPMGLTGAPATYARLKDLTFGPIPAPKSEPAVDPSGMTFKYFVDDDYGGAPSFYQLLTFLHNDYFPRISWAKLTLKPSKSKFFVDHIEPLGMLVGKHQSGTIVQYGLRANDKKRGKIEAYPVPRCEQEVEAFLYLTTYLKTLIPNRTELARIMKNAVIRAVENNSKEAPRKETSKEVTSREEADMVKLEERGKAGKKKGEGGKSSRKKGEAIGFQWGKAQQDAFEEIKRAIRENVIVGGDPNCRYYVTNTATIHGFTSVLFQLSKVDEEELEEAGRFPKGREKVVQFISQTFTDTESRYTDIERGYLAVIRTLEEIRYLILQSPFPVVVYTSPVIVGLLNNSPDEPKGNRIMWWQTRMGDFRIIPRSLKWKDLSTCLARVTSGVSKPWTINKEWEDVCVIDGAEVKQGGEVPRKLQADNGIRDKLSRRYEGMGRQIEYQEGKGFIVEGSAVLVYVDGACRGNGTPNVRGSVGLYAGPNHPASGGWCIPPVISSFIPRVTNQVAEIFALIYGVKTGIRLAQRSGLTRVIVALDSAYACGGITMWIDRWRRTGYVDVQNGSLFEYLDRLIQQVGDRHITIQFWNIGRDLNKEADRIARHILEEGIYTTDKLEDNGKSVDEDGVLENADKEMIPEREADRIQNTEVWQDWLEDDWYREVVLYLLFGKSDQLTENRLRKLLREAKKFVLIDTDPPQLAYREVSGDLSICIRANQVQRVLRRFHDNHGHFSIGIMSRNLIGRYYWPGRLKDIAQWCISCEACQQLGPLRNSTQIKPILSLQPMDMMGMDFLGPITPHSKNGSVYILLAVDYFSRFLFAHATIRNTGEAVVDFLENNITKIFGWPIAFYVDNGSHFVKGKLLIKLREVGTRLISAPVTNRRSVGLAERYVQLILAGLRAVIAARNAMDRWDEYLDTIVNAINTRVLKVHQYTPAQLFIGFNTRVHPLDFTLAEKIRQHRIVTEVYKDDTEPLMRRSEEEYDLRLAQIEEVRELTRERVLRDLEEREAKAAIPRYHAPKVGDLVLRRRFNVDKSLGMKLYPKWDGPYRLSKISKSGVSGELTDICNGGPYLVLSNNHNKDGRYFHSNV